MKLLKIQLFICFLVIFSATSSYALMSSEVKKAKEFMSVGMKPQAITILEKRIFEKPTDAKAHFLLATLYISEGELGNAKQRFKSAVMIDSDYGYKIGEVYKKEGLLAFDQEQYGQADRLLNTAVEYQPSLGKEIGQGYFNVGKKQLNRGKRSSADNFFSKAVKFDKSLRNQVSKLNQEYARNLLKAAKNKPKNQRKRYINEASKYLPKSEIDAVFPPPYMKIVFQKQFTGIGYTGGPENDGGMVILTNNVDCSYGQSITITGKNVATWYGGKFVPTTNNQFSFENKLRKKYGEIGARAPKGEKFTVTVKELTNSY